MTTLWKAIPEAPLLLWRYRIAFVGAGCVAIYVAFIFSGFDRTLFFDEREYFSIAKNFISSGIYAYEPGVSTASRPPGYLAFVIPLVALGFGKFGVVFAQTLLWGASVYLTGVISCRLRGPAAGGLAILFAALYPLCAFVTLTVYPQILTALLVLIFVWLLLEDPKNPLTTRDAVVVGIVMGFTILVSSILLPVLFGILLLRPFSSSSFGFRSLRLSIIAILVSSCLVGAWIGRNWVVLGTPTISTIVGFNLLYGNSENAAPELGTTANIDKYTEAVRGMHEVETDRALRNFAIEWIRNNPAAAIELYFKKFVQFFGYREVLKTSIAGLQLFQAVVAIVYYPLLLLSIVGVIYFAANNNSRGEIAMFLMYMMTAAVHAVFVQRLRYRAEVDFLLIIIAANFLGTLFPKFDRDNGNVPTPRWPLAIPAGKD